jgi:hypothetical protein
MYNSVIYRSPGGNPIKRPVTPRDPSNVLAAVLKKRFAAIHSATKTPKYRDKVSNGDESQVRQVIVLFENWNNALVCTCIHFEDKCQLPMGLQYCVVNNINIYKSTSQW